MTKGISFGVLSRGIDGSWNTSRVEGLPAPSLSTTAGNKPSLLVLPFSQAGAVVSLRQFTNNAFMQHFGIQPEERVGVGVDEDGDGFVNELTHADITAVTIYQATLPVPGRVIPDDPEVEKAVSIGEKRFEQIGCKHDSSRSEVAGNLSAKFPRNAVNRSFNALARGQFLQAWPEILVGCADDLIASEVAYD